MENLTSRPRAFYRPELDLLRLLAFLLVFLHHGLSVVQAPRLQTPILSAAFGMQIFFLLSAYLITELMLREIETSGTVHVRAFFVRRILRIWPLYFVFVISYLIYSLATHAPARVIHGLIAFLLVSGNWYTALHGFLPTVINPLWSISLEEQFYLVWPTAVRLGKRRAIWILSVFSTVAAYLALLYLGDGHHTTVAVWTNGFVEFQFFGLGATLALLLHKRIYQPPSWLRAILLSLAIVSVEISESFFHFNRSDNAFASTLIPAYMLLGIGAILCLLGVYGLSVPKSFAPLLYLGRISYGLYVFHMLAFLCIGALAGSHLKPGPYVFARIIGGLALDIVLASLSYRFLELPFLKLKRKFTFVASRAN